MLRVLFTTALVSWCALFALPVMAFEQNHAVWSSLLKRHVVIAEDGNSSTLRYAGMQTDREELSRYLATLSAVSEAAYASWSKPQQLAFLINAYNAFTVELILTRYPKIESIKDLGSLFSSPWKKRFFSLLGKERHLDELEHEIIREPGVFDEPRIHVAVVCASIGCPMLRNNAFVAEDLERQLTDAMRRFLADKSRNRYNAASNTLQISKIFNWYAKDFAYQGDTRSGLLRLFSKHVDSLAATPEDRHRLARALTDGSVSLDDLDYDWRLNDTR